MVGTIPDEYMTPYFWKGAKWLRGLEFMSQDRPGFWDGVTIDAEEQGWVMQVEVVERGLKITATEDAVPYYLLCQKSAWSPRHEWYAGFMLAIEQQHEVLMG